MSFSESVARSQAAIFRALGEDATWTGVAGPVRIRRREEDEEIRLDQGELVATGRRIRVRKSEVPDPAEGNQVQILDAAGNPVAGALFTVAGAPELDRTAVWTCKVVPA